jgi:uncharacterized Fe-S cluster protein YjdI
MQKKYKKEKLTVIWKPNLCIHSAICIRGLSKVFDVNRKPWIDLEQANHDEIKRQVIACPSQALSFEEEE